jgi:hypothetical protein
MNWRILNEPQRLQKRIYRLIDGLCEPHRQLDALYPSLEAAIEDAIGWLQQSSINPLEHPVGVEVATGTGDWRTLRSPEPLLCRSAVHQ